MFSPDSLREGRVKGIRLLAPGFIFRTLHLDHNRVHTPARMPPFFTNRGHIGRFCPEFHRVVCSF